MRIPLAPYGRRELWLYGTVLTALVVVGAVLGFWWVSAGFVVPLAMLFYFFRDPEREIPDAPKILVAPADGRVTEISECDDERLGCRAKRVSIFLSVFSVHINRAPCAGRVASVTYEPGRKINAMKSESARVNESNTIVLETVEPPGLRILVRQISGAIARRIVCTCKPGVDLARGERFGMIKFGSRTDLCIPVEHLAELRVKPGSRVHAGKTVIGVLR